MDIFIQQIINGVTVGAVYAVVALGYTMVYGIIQLINFAHGEVVMIGAMVAFSVIVALAGSGLPPIVIVLIATGVRDPRLHAARLHDGARRLPAAARRAAPRAAHHRDRHLDHPAALRDDDLEPQPPRVPADRQDRDVPVGGATITNVQITIIVMCVLLMAGLATLVYRTKLGTAMRATAQNPQIAGLMGVDVNRIVASTFVIGAALAAVAGVMVASYYGIAHYTMGANLGLKAFCAAVLGGIGNLPGAMLGGVLLGVVEALGAGYIGDLTDLCRYGLGPAEACANGGHFVLFGSNYQDVFAFIVLILVLVFRPSGLLGERVGDRA